LLCLSLLSLAIAEFPLPLRVRFCLSIVCRSTTPALYESLEYFRRPVLPNRPINDPKISLTRT